MRALIIGAGGIGGALARLLHADGWQLMLAGHNRKSPEAVAADCGDCRVAEVDATDWSSMEALAGELADFAGDEHLAIVNTVGSILIKPAHLTKEAEWQKTLQLNLTSAFLTTRLAATHGKPASVVLFSTVAARAGLKNHEAIAAAKAGVEGLVRSAAATYAGKNIRFNAIAPGLVDTPLAEHITSREAALETSKKMHPLGRIGKPEQIARIAATLVHPDNDWITGAVWSVDGGLANCHG